MNANVDLSAVGEATDLGDLGEQLGAELRGLLSHPARKARRDFPQDTKVSVFVETVAAISAVVEEPFLLGGTLLGFARGGEVMEHDYDVDLGVLPNSLVPEELADQLVDLPDYVVQVGQRKLVLTHECGFSTDVFFHCHRDGLIWHGTDHFEWWNTPFAVTPVRMHGIPVWIPVNTDLYLREHYGNWSSPIPFYDLAADTPNMQFMQNGSAARLLYRRCRSAIVNGDRWAAEFAARELRDNFDIDVTAQFAPSRLLDARASSSPSTDTLDA